MDRKFCVLLYSNYSKASVDLLNYIKNIPLDFPTMVGLTMICIDNPEFKFILSNNGITFVPTLLVEYYNGTKQKFEKDYIYKWIDQIMASSQPKGTVTPQSALGGPPAVTSLVDEVSSGVSPRPPAAAPTHSTPISVLSSEKPFSSENSGFHKKTDISSIALEMQKNRDLDLAEIKEHQKPI
jgi:hypothetical protein